MVDNDRSLPDWLDAYERLTSESEPPRLFHKWTAVSVIASALQRKCYVKLGISLTFYPNFYIVLVGPSATGKGTAMGYALDIIEQVPNIHLSAQATSLQALIRKMKDTNLTDIDHVTGKQYFHSSLSIFSEEFTVFLGFQNRELITALCDWYDCRNRWTYDTIKRNVEEIIGVWVNMLAGTTPDNIQSSLPMEVIGGGLTSRIIFVFEEESDKIVIFPPNSEREIQLQQYLIADLEQINLLSGSFSMTQETSKIYSDWAINAKKNPPFHDKKFDGYCGRRRNHLLSLAMICSVSHSNDLIIKAEDIERAIMLLSEVEVKMPLTFRGIGKSGISDLIGDATAFFEASETAEMPYWQFAQYFECNMDKFMMDRVLTTLQAANYIKIFKRPGVGDTIKIIGK